MKNNNSPVADFFKKVWLLLRAMLSSLSFAALFAGIAIAGSSHGIYIIIIACKFFNIKPRKCKEE